MPGARGCSRPGDALDQGMHSGLGMLLGQGCSGPGDAPGQGCSQAREGRQSPMQSKAERAAAVPERSATAPRRVGLALEGTVAGDGLGACGAQLRAGCCRWPGCRSGCRGEGEQTWRHVLTAPWPRISRGNMNLGVTPFLGAEPEAEPGMNRCAGGEMKTSQCFCLRIGRGSLRGHHKDAVPGKLTSRG